MTIRFESSLSSLDHVSTPESKNLADLGEKENSNQPFKQKKGMESGIANGSEQSHMKLQRRSSNKQMVDPSLKFHYKGSSTDKKKGKVDDTEEHVTAISRLSKQSPTALMRNIPKEKQKMSQKSPSGKKYPLLDPVKVFETWKRQHSAQSLRREGHSIWTSDRRYMYAYFACPRQAGIQAGRYTYALLLAVATNRTLMFRYKSIWRSLQDENRREECAKVLLQADWIPTMDEFYDPFLSSSKPPPNITVMSLASHEKQPGGKINSIKRFIDQGKQAHDFIGDDLLIEVPDVWGLGRYKKHWRGLTDLTEHYVSTYYHQALGGTPFAEDDRVKKMYTEGWYFLYGMLFSESFLFTTELKESVQPTFDRLKRLSLDDDEDNVFSIGMHSRHIDPNDTGEDVKNQFSCLKSLLLSNQARNSKKCRLFLMSDREPTILLTSKHAEEEYKCEVIIVEDRKVTNSSNAGEHGPFAGLGFFQDLVVVSRATSAYATRKRSSSALVVELMEYNRRMRAWQRDGTRRLPPLMQCIM